MDYLLRKNSSGEIDYKFIKNTLSKFLSINVKIDLAALVVSNDSGNIRFHYKDKKGEITEYSRRVFDYYEEAITYLEKYDLYNMIPIGYSLFLEIANDYNFGDSGNMVIPYTERPKNNIIASYMTDSNGKVLPPHHFLINTICNEIRISPPPNIFIGFLGTKQLEELLKAITSEKFSGFSFLYNILRIITGEEYCGFMGSNTIEGICIYYAEDKEWKALKVIDPSFKDEKLVERTNENSRNDSIKRYRIKMYREMVEWILKNDYVYFTFLCDMCLTYRFSSKESEFKISARTLDTAFFNLVIFHKDSLNSKFKGFVDPDREFRKIQMDKIEDPRIKELINSSDTYKLLYTVIYEVFSKIHKRGNAKIGTKDNVEKINIITESHFKSLRS